MSRLDPELPKNSSSTSSQNTSQQEYFVGLGVTYVISGDFADWNFGLAQGSWGRYVYCHSRGCNHVSLYMLIDVGKTAMLPTAGSGYSFARTAFGPFGGYLTGTATQLPLLRLLILLQLIIKPYLALVVGLSILIYRYSFKRCRWSTQNHICHYRSCCRYLIYFYHCDDSSL